MVAHTRDVVLTKAKFPSVFAKRKTQAYSETLRSAQNRNLRTIDWNPLGTLIATGSSDRTLRVWNPEKPQLKNSTELRGHTGPVERVAWNPTREAELASCSADGTVRLWDVRSKAAIGKVEVGGAAFTLSWRPDGSELVVGRKDDVLVPVERSAIRALPSHRQNVQTNQTIFSWTGQEMFLTTGEGQVKIVDYPSMNVLHVLNAHTSSCYSIDFSPAAEYLAVGGSDALITLWDTRDWICQRTLTSMAGPVRSVSFSFDGCYLVGGSDEGVGIEVACVESDECVHKVETLSPTPCVQWHPSRYVLAYSDPAGLKIIGGVERP